MVEIVRGWRKLTRSIRGWLFRAVIIAGGGRCGRGLQVEPHCTLRWGPHRGIEFGSRVRFGRGVILDVPRGARLVLGDGVKVMHYTVIAASELVVVGSGTQVAEHCSIRDSDHRLGIDGQVLPDDLDTSATRVGNDVWLSRGVAILRGSVVGDGAVVGANSVVVRSRPVAARTKVAGAPAKRMAQ